MISEKTARMLEAMAYTNDDDYKRMGSMLFQYAETLDDGIRISKELKKLADKMSGDFAETIRILEQEKALKDKGNNE